MLKKTNQHGYALLTVLLVSTLLILIAFTFFNQSVNTVKQNRAVETRSKSVSLAEMGVTYYQQAIENAYQQAKKKIEEDMAQKIVYPNGYVFTAAEKFKTNIDDITKEQFPDKENRNISFEIKDVKKVVTNNNGTSSVDITFNSVGKDNGKTATLTANIIFTMKQVTGNSSGSGGSGNPINFNEVKKEGTVCQYPKIDGYSNCNTIELMAGTADLNLGNGNNNNNLENKIIYANGKLTFDGNNVNNANNMKIHAEDDITVNNNMQNADNLKIETKKSIIIHGHLDVTGSRLLAGENVTIDKYLTINNSTMCVGGTLTVNGKRITSNLPKGVYVKTINATQYEKACGSGTTSGSIIDWGEEDPNIDIDYKY